MKCHCEERSDEVILGYQVNFHKEAHVIEWEIASRRSQ